MTVESEVANLTTAVNALTNSVNVKKTTLDVAVDSAASSATIAGTKATQASVSEAIATTKAKEASASAVSAEESKNLAAAIVFGGDTVEEPAAGSVPLSRLDKTIHHNWLAYDNTQSALSATTAQGAITELSDRKLDASQAQNYLITQAIENPSGATGLIIPDDTQYVFTPQQDFQILAFVPATLTQEMQIYREGEYGIYLTTDKKLRMNWGGSYQTIEPLSVSDDWIDIQFTYNDNESSAVTFDVTINGAAFGTQQVVTYSDAYIRSIFASEYGFLHVASMGYGTLTSAGVNKMNNWGDACGSLPSVAGSAVTLSQTTGAARPVIGRVPVWGRRNLWTNSDSLSGFTISNATLTQTSLQSKLDPQRALMLYVPNAGNYSSLIRRSFDGGTGFSFEVEAAGYTSITLVSSNTSNYGASFNLVTGEVSQPTSAVLGTATMQNLGGDRWRIFLPTSFGTQVYAKISTTGAKLGADTAQTYDGVSGVYIGSAMSEAAVVVSNYQRVGATAQDVTEAGVPDQEYLYFDRSDDILAGTISAITGGEIIIAGRNGIWHDSLTVAAGTFSIGPSTYTGGPAGILAVIGDFIGCAVLDRAFTTAERDAIYALFKARGAAGVFEVSDVELLANNSFADGTTGWAATASDRVSFSVSSGVAYFEVLAGFSSVATGAGQSPTTEIGAAYILEADVIAPDQPMQVAVPGIAGAVSASASGAAIARLAFVAIATTSALRVGFYSDGESIGDTGQCTEMRLRKLILNTGA